MFPWTPSDDDGMARIARQFGQMVEDGRHIFDAATNTLLGGGDPAVIRDDLFKTDRRINAVEQKIRRELVVHVSVAGAADFPTCLKLMSLVKDAERIGDYAKNIFELRESTADLGSDPLQPDLVQVKDRISRLLAKMRNLHESENEEQARAFCAEADELLRHCDARVEALLADAGTSRHPVAAALLYRYMKRVMAHATNIVSAVFMPVDKLDYFDEHRRDRDPPS